MSAAEVALSEKESALSAALSAKAEAEKQQDRLTQHLDDLEAQLQVRWRAGGCKGSPWYKNKQQTFPWRVSAHKLLQATAAGSHCHLLFQPPAGGQDCHVQGPR